MNCGGDPWRIVGMVAVGVLALMLLTVGVVMWTVRRRLAEERRAVEAPERQVHGVPYERARLEGP